MWCLNVLFSGSVDVWIGLRQDASVRGVYKWDDGTYPPLLPWDDLAPSYNQCVYQNLDRKWVDGDCNELHHVVCQYSLGKHNWHTTINMLAKLYPYNRRNVEAVRSYSLLEQTCQDLAPRLQNASLEIMAYAEDNVKLRYECNKTGYCFDDGQRVKEVLCICDMFEELVIGDCSHGEYRTRG